MRIIAGKAKGTKLYTLEGENTRPTLDRVKEALFNIIQFDIPGKRVLDLFAGSGALGIEAISRGAETATFCDNSIDAIQVIKTNIENTKCTDKSVVLQKDYLLALNYLAKSKQKFDLIFLDPPYRTDFSDKAIEKILELDLLSKEGIIILETDDANKEETIKKEYIQIFDKRIYGRVILIFIRKE